jgi:hypothetical protein
MANQAKYGGSARSTAVVSSKQALGEFGKEILGGDNLGTTTGVVFRQIFAVSDCEIESITDDDAPAEQAGLLEDVPIMAGTILYGRFKNITLADGILVCYKEGKSNKIFTPILGA